MVAGKVKRDKGRNDADNETGHKRPRQIADSTQDAYQKHHGQEAPPSMGLDAEKHHQKVGSDHQKTVADCKRHHCYPPGIDTHN